MNESDKDFERENEKLKEDLEEQKRAYLKIIDMIKAQKETEASENSRLKRVNGELEDENRKLKQTIIGLDEVVAEKNLENLKLKGELEEDNELMGLLSDEVCRNGIYSRKN